MENPQDDKWTGRTIKYWKLDEFEAHYTSKIILRVEDTLGWLRVALGMHNSWYMVCMIIILQSWASCSPRSSNQVNPVYAFLLFQSGVYCDTLVINHSVILHVTYASPPINQVAAYLKKLFHSCRSTCAFWNTRWRTRMSVRGTLWPFMMAAAPSRT